LAEQDRRLRLCLTSMVSGDGEHRPGALRPPARSSLTARTACCPAGFDAPFIPMGWGVRTGWAQAAVDESAAPIANTPDGAPGGAAVSQEAAHKTMPARRRPLVFEGKAPASRAPRVRLSRTSGAPLAHPCAASAQPYAKTAYPHATQTFATICNAAGHHR
jgi:hypothetical protein